MSACTDAMHQTPGDQIHPDAKCTPMIGAPTGRDIGQRRGWPLDCTLAALAEQRPRRRHGAPHLDDAGRSQQHQLLAVADNQFEHLLRYENRLSDLTIKNSQIANYLAIYSLTGKYTTVVFLLYMLYSSY